LQKKYLLSSFNFIKTNMLSTYIRGYWK